MRKIIIILFVIILISSVFLIEHKREEAREMRIKEYLKNVWERLKYDESGQYEWPSRATSRYTRPKSLYAGLTTQQISGLEAVQREMGYDPRQYPSTTHLTPQPITRQPVTRQPVTQLPTGTPAQVYYGGEYGGGISMPSYQAPAISLNVPTFAWSPTGAQAGGWEAEGARRAAMIYEPQREELARQLERYRGTVGEERERIHPMYDIQSRAVANIIENTVKQALVEDAIRRGAETGGELPRQIAGAGRFEVQQRREIETERGQAEATLSRALLTHERETGERITSLTQLQGLHGQQIRAALEREVRDWAFRETGSKFEAELAVASLKNAIATAEYEAQYQKSVFQAQQQQQTWERGFSEQQLALQRQLATYAGQPAPGKKTYPYKGYDMTISELISAGAFEPKSIFDIEEMPTDLATEPYETAGFKAGQVSGMRRY